MYAVRRFGELGVAVCLVAACGRGDAPPLISTGSIIGQVEVSEGVPASTGVIGLLGTPLGAVLADDGTFQLMGTPPGSWTLEIRPGGAFAQYPEVQRPLGVNAGEVRNVGVITLSG